MQNKTQAQQEEAIKTELQMIIRRHTLFVAEAMTIMKDPNGDPAVKAWLMELNRKFEQK
jgi:hypothetical protein